MAGVPFTHYFLEVAHDTEPVHTLMKKSDKTETKAFQYEALALQVRGTSFASILCDDERELAPILRDLREERYRSGWHAPSAWNNISAEMLHFHLKLLHMAQRMPGYRSACAELAAHVQYYRGQL